MKTACPLTLPLLLSLLCIGPFTPACQGDDASPVKNLLENGGLEGELAPATGLPAGWEVTQDPPNSYKVEVVEGGRTGKRCLRISGEGTNIQVRLKHLPLIPNQRSVISGWVKVTGGQGMVTLMHRYNDADGKRLNSTTIGGVNATKAVDWVQTAMIEHPEYTRPGTVEANFIINAGGKIDALIDDLEVFTLAVTPDDLLWAAGEFESHYDRVLPRAYRTATSAGGTLETSLDDKRPANGRFCLRLKSNADWAMFTMWGVKYDATKLYTFTGKVRVNSGSAGIRIDYYADDNRTNWLGSSTAKLTESKDWKTFSVDTTDNTFLTAAQITATAICEGNTEAFFDQFVMLAK